MNLPPSLRKAVSLLAVPAILGLVMLFAPWRQIIELLGRLSALNLLELSGWALLFHTAKSTRFWMTLRELDIQRPPILTALSYLAGHPMATLPGGEMYRPVVLKEHADVPASRGTAAVVLQGVVESAALILVSLAGALSLGAGLVPVLAVGALMVGAYVVLVQGWVVKGRRIINKVPFVDVSRKSIRQFSEDNQRLLKPWSFLRLLAVTALTILAGGGIVYIASHALGHGVPPLQSALVYALPTLLASVALVPGATEATAFGVLALLGIPPGAAAAIILLTRTFTAFIGAAIGGVALLIVKLRARGVIDLSSRGS